eukprot:TRINITY_DN61068_c0_g1_i1.p1 TRINITY_DN61068_c0_g1~~TRINITY_DN61068_c0_g1_i1.p1  ORF type:complete len:374 (+),score=51.34 TRINITY_DN61068_c0_g1_i1:45-1124(+)
MATSLLGLTIAVLSSIFNGTFPAWKDCIANKPDPVIFNGYVCLGVLLSSLPVPLVTGDRYAFPFYGVCAGGLFVFAALFSFIAQTKVGLATAQAVWSSSAILVAFAWGAFGPSEVAAPMASLLLSLLAVLIIIAGALIVVNCRDIARRISRSSSREADGGQVQIGTVPAAESEAQEQANLTSDGGTNVSDRLMGLASAASVGIFGGSVLVPFKFIPQDSAGLRAVPSFGVGALIVGIMVTAAYSCLFRKGPRHEESGSTRQALLFGILSGITWNAGNLCSIVAQEPPTSLPYGIAYPILQCAMVFGGMLGIFVFREIQGLAVAIFWLGATILVLGVVVLSLFGPGSGSSVTINAIAILS